jgi:hypothetical protein
MVDNTALVWTFENKGDVIRAENVLANKFLKLAGRTGFGISRTKLIMREGAAEGSRHRRTKRLARDISFPIAIFGADRAEVEDSFRRFARLIQDDVSAPRLVATYPDGKRLYTEIHFAGGGDPMYGTDDTRGRDFAKLEMSFTAPSPYWTQEDAVSYPFNFNVDPSTDNWVEDMAEMPLISSQTAGSVTIENPGDVPAFAVWTLRGPMNSFSASVNGQGFVYENLIPEGTTIVINTLDKTVKQVLPVPVDPDDGNRYDALGTAPKLFAIPQGQIVVDVVAENTTIDVSLVSMYFNPRRELVFG